MTILFWSLIGLVSAYFAASGIIALIGRIRGWGRIHDEEEKFDQSVERISEHIARQQKNRLAREFEKESTDGN